MNKQMSMYRNGGDCYCLPIPMKESLLKSYSSFVSSRTKAHDLVQVGGERAYDDPDWTLCLDFNTSFPPALYINANRVKNVDSVINEYCENPGNFLSGLSVLPMTIEEVFESIHSSPIPYAASSAITTDYCNLQCVMCMFHSESAQYSFAGTRSKNRDRCVLSPNTLYSFLDQLPKGSYITFSAAGEYLLYPKAFEFVAYAKKIDLVPQIITNGVLLTEKNGELALDSGLFNLSVSVEGYDATTYAKYRKGGDFSLVKKNIAKFSNKMRTQSGEGMVSINTILFPDIISHKADVLRQWNGIADTVSFLVERVDYLGNAPRPLTKTPVGKPCFEMVNGPLLLATGFIAPCCSIAIGEWFEEMPWLLSLEEHSLSYIMERYREYMLDPESPLSSYCRRCGYKANSYRYRHCHERYVLSPYSEYHQLGKPSPESSRSLLSSIWRRIVKSDD